MKTQITSFRQTPKFTAALEELVDTTGRRKADLIAEGLRALVNNELAKADKKQKEILKILAGELQ